MSTTSRRGRLITFEGGDGSGKSTQMRMLAERLRNSGFDVVENIEPGGTSIGHQIRRILLDPANRELSSTAELLLYFASRAQAVDETIVPALKRGAIVLSDRYTDSTLAYQGGGRELGREVVLQLHRIACHGVDPHLTIYIDIEVEAGLARTKKRAPVDRMDDQAIEFHRRVRRTYLDMAAAEPQRIVVIDGAPAVEAVAEQIWLAVQPILE
jgi:dTMP kinase